jgi:type IV pilus assembly protein PilQ
MKRLLALPGTGLRTLRALGCGAGAVLLLAAALPEGGDGAVVSFSVVPVSGQALVVVGVDGEVRVKDFALTNPDRIVVDISGASLAVKKGGYDRVARGGVLDVRYAQNQPGVVRVVLTLAGPKNYEVKKDLHEVRIAVDGGDGFAAWRVGRPGLPAPALAKPSVSPSAEYVEVPKAMVSRVTTVSTSPASAGKPVTAQQVSQQPRITIAWENAPITDVIAQFAAFSGRTIIPSKNVSGNVSAEIINQPWDVAFRAILNANGYDAVEDPSGIIIVQDLASARAAPSFEPLVTRTIRLNYTEAVQVANALRERLTRDCGQTTAQQQTPIATQPVAPAQGTPAAPQGTQTPQPTQSPTTQIVDLRCPQRGAVTADPLSNSVSITDVPSAIQDLIAYARTLDQRQPQVNIKAKIILVDRTQLEALGLRYDLGSTQQHFNSVVQRVDSTGNAGTGNVISLGGNAISAVANAAVSVPNATLSVIYSAAIGAFDFTTFLDALTQSSLLDVQAEPSVTTLSGRPATLISGTQVPVQVPAPLTGGQTVPQVAIQMRETGIQLAVTPTVTNNRQIMMSILAENSDVQIVGGTIGAIFPQQRITNVVLVGDGETVVIGGLTQTSVTLSRTGIPILVDLPLIGRLFGVTNRNETKRDLLILITPHIVDEGDMTMEPRRTP